MTTQLKVNIIGGGLGGLTAAIAFRRIGHSVKIFEKSSFSSEAGLAVAISPDAVRILESFGIDLEAHGGVAWRAMHSVSGMTLQDVLPPIKLDAEAQYGRPLYTVFRSDVHTALREAATSDNGTGPPAELHLSSRVASYDGDACSVTLEDGTVHTGDLIIAADGVHSKAATYVNGFDCPAQGTENVVIRFIVPSEVLLADPVTAPLLARGAGHFANYLMEEHKFMVHYDCRDSKLQNFGLYIPTPNIEGDELSKVIKSSRAELKKATKGFHPAIERLADKTEEILPIWRITERAPVPKCTKGRLVVIGDAAHPVRPLQGQGFTNGVQDAGVLQVLFKDVKAGDDASIVKRLQAFQEIRQARVAAVQLYSSKSIEQNPAKAMEAEVRKWLPDAKLPQNQEEMNDWLMSYNAADHARVVLTESRA